MARDPGKLSDQPWSGDIEIAAAHVLEGTRVRRALERVDVAYYLIHSLGTGASFEQRHREAAAIFAETAMAAAWAVRGMVDRLDDPQILNAAARGGWTVLSMCDDFARVWPADLADSAR
jgi:hypothetical protein